ncbi:MAG: AtpZ/AtpI family protein [Clostridiales bacterium]|nr:AtpZ/AtpI family protein [Clostridiales bacterium]
MKSSDNSQVGQAFAMIFQVGISMMTPIFLCAAAGCFLDKTFHMQIWFLILVFLGIAAGFRNTYYLLKGFFVKDPKNEAAHEQADHQDGTHHRLEEEDSWEKPKKRS